MSVIDLNCDMGESFGSYSIGMDEEIIQFITSANVACGYHAGDPLVMEKTVRIAKEHGVGVGAHPGYPDLMGFGRRDISASPREITAYVMYQVGALTAFTAAYGIKLQHVKTHGKLYSTAWVQEDVAKATAEGIALVDSSFIQLIMAGSKGDLAARASKEQGLRIAREAFPDRAYQPDGALVPRGSEGAVIHNPQEVTARAIRMACERKVKAIDGTDVEMEIDTICVHGDNPSALSIVKQIREELDRSGVLVQPLGITLCR